MSRDFDDKEKDVLADGEELSSIEPETNEGSDDSRRDFLKSLGKWSGAAIGIALLGNAMSPSDLDAEDEFSEGPEESQRCLRCRCRCRCRCIVRCRCRCW